MRVTMNVIFSKEMCEPSINGLKIGFWHMQNDDICIPPIILIISVLYQTRSSFYYFPKMC